MTYYTHEISDSGRPSFDIQFKAVVGFAVLMLVLVGAVIGLFGSAMPFWAGVLSGMAGGASGFVFSRFRRRPAKG